MIYNFYLNKLKQLNQKWQFTDEKEICLYATGIKFCEDICSYAFIFPNAAQLSFIFLSIARFLFSCLMGWFGLGMYSTPP